MAEYGNALTITLVKTIRCMSFHLGKPILVMSIVAVIAGAFVLARPSERKADLTLWVFDDSHDQMFRRLLPKFEREHHVTVNVNLVALEALDLRLSSLLMSDPTSNKLPDLAEIEIGSVGRYFRAPVDEIGFRPLNAMLKGSGWYDQIMKQRFAPWSKRDVIFGVPFDVHPVTLTYREDLFREAGIDLSQAQTWPEFHEACWKFEQYWRGRGYRHRHALEAGQSDTAMIQMMLLQRHINLVDQYDEVHINDPKVAQTVAFYATLVAGPRAVGGKSASSMGAFARDLNEGNLCAMLTPDWRIDYIRRYADKIAGKLRMMPLPKFEPSDAPTSTWGGTMIGITRACKHPKLAFELIEYLYLSPDGLRERRRHSDILPPIISEWDSPVYHKPDPFFGGQRIEELYVRMARQLPTRYQSPASTIAAASLTYVLNSAVAYLDEHGNADGLEAQCQVWLDAAARDINRRIDHWRIK